MEKWADLCWEGLTLKHISHKKIVLPYLLFTFMSLLFELYLSALFFAACIVFYTFGFKPGMIYYISGAVLAIMLIMTISIIKKLGKRHFFNKDKHLSANA